MCAQHCHGAPAGGARAISTGCLTMSSSPRHGQLWSVLWALSVSVEPAIAADGCTQTSAPIETDRPDVTNSSVVVPLGSLQDENGINLSRLGNASVFDGTYTRLRLGVAPCVEVLVDPPTYVTSFRGAVASGFTDVVPAVKWQISPTPEKFNLSVTAGLGLPTGAARSWRSRPICNSRGPWSLAGAGPSPAR